MRRAPIPVSSKDPNVIRFRFLERPFRFYHGLSYHYQAFIKTAVLSWFMIIPVYNFVYYIANLKSKAEIMAKMDPDMNSDNLKKQIIDFKRRDKLGLVERYEGSQVQKDLGGEGLSDNLGVPKHKYFIEAGEDEYTRRSANRNKR